MLAGHAREHRTTRAPPARRAGSAHGRPSPGPGVPAERVEAVCSRIAAIALDPAVGGAAETAEPPALRTLVAVHLASAVSLADDLEAIVTYDRRLAEAAVVLGLPTASPGA